MSILIQQRLKPLNVNTNFKTLEEASAAFKGLVEQINKVLINTIETNSQVNEIEFNAIDRLAYDLLLGGS